MTMLPQQSGLISASSFYTLLSARLSGRLTFYVLFWCSLWFSINFAMLMTDNTLHTLLRFFSRVVSDKEGFCLQGLKEFRRSEFTASSCHRLTSTSTFLPVTTHRAISSINPPVTLQGWNHLLMFLWIIDISSTKATAGKTFSQH